MCHGRHVASLVEQLDPYAGDAAGKLLGIHRRDQAILFAPDEQSRMGSNFLL
jgi:hypothetical protein